MSIILLAIIGAGAGYLLEWAAVAALRGREFRRIPAGKWIAACSLAAGLPAAYLWDPEQLLPNAALLLLLTAVTLTDVMATLILNRTLLCFAVPIVVLRLWFPLENGLLSSLTGTFAAFFLMLLLAVLSKGRVGGGDVKLYALLGFFFGIGSVLVNLFLASVFAVSGTLFLMAVRRRKKPEVIPFGPYIALAGAVMLFLQM